tara:strand:- start:179 stop:394 length:216 start_codon:yes stop_codon:yes gene_type:complete
MYCWICNDTLFEKYYLIPSDDVRIIKKNAIIYKIDTIEFIYNCVCEECLNNYLRNYPINFKKILNREIGKK